MDNRQTDRRTCRRASIAELPAIISINQNIYDGNDYLPALFYTFFQKPNLPVYVLEQNKILITAVVLRVLEDGKAVGAMAGRTQEQYQKKHLGPARNVEFRTKLLQDYPKLEKVVFITEVDRAERMIREGQGEIYYHWKTVSFRLRAEDILTVLRNGSSMAQRLTYTDAVQLLASGEKIQSFIKRYANCYIPHGANWMPGSITAEEMRDLVANNTTFISTRDLPATWGTPGKSLLQMELTAFSYSTAIPIKSGTLAVIFFYGEIEDMVNHLVSQLQHLYNIFDKLLTIYYHLPLGIDSAKLSATLDKLKLSSCEKFNMANNNEYILGSVKLNAFKAML